MSVSLAYVSDSGITRDTDMSTFMGLSQNKDLKNGLIRGVSVPGMGLIPKELLQLRQLRQLRPDSRSGLKGTESCSNEAMSYLWHKSSMLFCKFRMLL